jgi:hypothetical protein
LALSSLAERRRARLGDERSLRFVGGLAEGTETIAAYVLLFLLPGHAVLIVWAFTAVVAVTAAQRVVIGARLLREPARATSSGISETGGTRQRPGNPSRGPEQPAA